MDAEQRVAYYHGAKSLYEAFALRLTAEETKTIFDRETDDLRVREAIVEAREYLLCLYDWAASDDDETPPPHPRIARVFRS